MRMRSTGAARAVRTRRGQALVELALVAPLFFMVLFGIIVLGIGVFYQQQVTNAAREAARYASIHSATAQCPTVSQWDPPAAQRPTSYNRCDRPEDGWPRMTAAGRGVIFGMPSSGLRVSACWSGYVDDMGNRDAQPPGEYDPTGAGTPVTVASTWAPCLLGDVDPSTDASLIPCAPGLARSDTASNSSERRGVSVANQVTAFACYEWQPPLAGFLLIPETITLRGVVSEPIERQQ